MKIKEELERQHSVTDNNEIAIFEEVDEQMRPAEPLPQVSHSIEVFSTV